ncbi:MAG: dihydrofolate reductase [Hyphomicrobiales bacterium]|nr:MAG: dihydrofolate reductase [Hyphomicrobiales bacterium]
MRISLIVAAAENGIIGAEGGMPWRLSGDLRMFRRVTMGKPVIMGRRTFQSLPKALDGRDNIVITRQADFAAGGAVPAGSPDEALAMATRFAASRDADEICVIGGAQIYREFLPRAQRIYLTRVHAYPEGDTRFPELDMTAWREVSSEFHQAGDKDSADYSFIVLDRA